MAYLNDHATVIGKLLQFDFPQAIPSNERASAAAQRRRSRSSRSATKAMYCVRIQ
jgi:hypothetical protein